MELDKQQKGDLERYRALIKTSERFKHIDFSIKRSLEKHLNTCAQRGFNDLADYLISERGANVNMARGRDGFAPIHHAAVGGKTLFAFMYFRNLRQIITRSRRNHSCIVTSSCNVNVVDSWRTTPLHLSAMYGLADVSKILIANGDTNARDFKAAPYWRLEKYVGAINIRLSCRRLNSKWRWRECC